MSCFNFNLLPPFSVGQFIYLFIYFRSWVLRKSRVNCCWRSSPPFRPSSPQPRPEVRASGSTASVQSGAGQEQKHAHTTDQTDIIKYMGSKISTLHHRQYTEQCWDREQCSLHWNIISVLDIINTAQDSHQTPHQTPLQMLKKLKNNMSSSKRKQLKLIKYGIKYKTKIK